MFARMLLIVAIGVGAGNASSSSALAVEADQLPYRLAQLLPNNCQVTCTTAAGQNSSCTGKWCKTWQEENGISCWNERKKKACNCSKDDKAIHGVFLGAGMCDTRDHEYVPK